MKDLNQRLKVMTDDELVAFYNAVNNGYDAEMAMDGSGEFGYKIDKAFEPIFDAINEELNQRDIPFFDDNYQRLFEETVVNDDLVAKYK